VPLGVDHVSGYVGSAPVHGDNGPSLGTYTRDGPPRGGLQRRAQRTSFRRVIERESRWFARSKRWSAKPEVTGSNPVGRVLITRPNTALQAGSWAADAARRRTAEGRCGPLGVHLTAARLQRSRGHARPCGGTRQVLGPARSQQNTFDHVRSPSATREHGYSSFARRVARRAAAFAQSESGCATG
jgi:hypothetical protein